MLQKLLKEREQIIKNIKCIPLEDIYEERQTDLQRLDEINEEIHNKNYETHSNGIVLCVFSIDKMSGTPYMVFSTFLFLHQISYAFLMQPNLFYLMLYELVL